MGCLPAALCALDPARGQLLTDADMAAWDDEWDPAKPSRCQVFPDKGLSDVLLNTRTCVSVYSLHKSACLLWVTPSRPFTQMPEAASFLRVAMKHFLGLFKAED